MAAGTITHGNAPESSQILQKLARQTPYYKRNAPHLCSFFAKGTCSRGAACPYRHEMPAEESELSHQNIQDRYRGENDPVAEKMLKKVENFAPKPPEDPVRLARPLFLIAPTKIPCAEQHHALHRRPHR